MAPIPPADTLRFVLRANYPNTYARFRDRDARWAGRPPHAQPGYLPPVVEWHVDGERATHTTAVRGIDLPRLNHPDPAIGRDQLANILRARAGDLDARDALTRAARPLLQEADRFCRRLRLVDDEFVVPSYTPLPRQATDVSHKGAILLRLGQLGYPVPDFAIVSAHAHRRPASERARHLAAAVANLEAMTDRKLGDIERPLVLAMRYAMPEYIPGLMPTYLNVGVTEHTHPTLVRIYGRDAADKMLLNNLDNLAALLDPDSLAVALDDRAADDSADERAEAIEARRAAVRAVEPALVTDAHAQLRFLDAHSDRFFAENRDLVLTLSRGREHRPSLILQQMICTVRGGVSYPGVLYSRNPRTGRARVLESVRGIFGEEFMTGTVRTDSDEFASREEIRERFAEVYHFTPALDALERDHAASVTIEFAAEAVRRARLFALLQLNLTEMTGRAMVVAAMDLYREGAIPGERVAELVRPYHLRQLTSPAIDDPSLAELRPFARGYPILPRGAATARLYLSASAALEAKRRGETVCFCRPRFLPSDTVVMGEVDVILGLTPAAIHVVTACRGLGIPAFLDLAHHGVRIDGGRLLNEAGEALAEGDWITVSCKLGTLFRGRARFKPARLQQFLAGEPLQLDDREREEYELLGAAMEGYDTLVRGLRVDQIHSLDELIKLIRTDLRDDARAALAIVNRWFDAHTDSYVHAVLTSELGTHLERFRVYERLTPERRAELFRRATRACRHAGLSGLTAGSFMLGRFVSTPQPVALWQALAPAEVAFLVEEWVLFRKYMQVLDDVGERRINRARQAMLGRGLGDLPLAVADARVFAPLKLSGCPLADVEAALRADGPAEARILVEMLRRPWSALYDFDQRWSIGPLEALCREEGVEMPGRDEV